MVATANPGGRLRGPPGADRNLYLTGATFNGKAVTGTNLAFMMGGPQSFTFTKAAPAPTPTPAPGTDWEAEAKRLAAANATLTAEKNALATDKTALTAEVARLKGVMRKTAADLSAAAA